MSKITIALNSMIENCDQITDVMQYKQTYYFRFLKYIWSIGSYTVEPTTKFVTVFSMPSKTVHYSAVYYPDYYNVADLKEDLEKQDLEITKFRYSSESDNARETYDTYKALFNFVREKLYNVDNVLDDIISFRENHES